MRQIVLDTETTGLEPSAGHRIIEIGCVELVERKLTGNTFHQYINPQRKVDDGAIEVHGITNEFLEDKPYFADIYDDFLKFVQGAELVIHNAPFDVGFINHEIALLENSSGQSLKKIEHYCTILDTLKMARDMHPGQKNTLDALCKRYYIDNSNRELHGALLDSEILADVYLAMTGGQTRLTLSDSDEAGHEETIQRLSADREPLKILRATEQELINHENYMDMIEEKSDGEVIWRTI